MKDKALYTAAIVLACSLPMLLSLGLCVAIGDEVPASMHVAINVGHVAFLSLCVREVVEGRDDLVTYRNFFRCLMLTFIAMTAQGLYLVAIAIGWITESDAVSVSVLINQLSMR